MGGASPAPAGRARAAPPAGDSDTRYEPISTRWLESELLAGADGVDTEAESVGGETGVEEREKSNSDDSDEDEDALEERKEKRAQAERSSRLNMMANAAFGGGKAPPGFEKSVAGTASEASSSARKKARRGVFPARGITCVGCALGTKIKAVDTFVQQNIACMTEESLFKMASLVYKREVAEKAEREGAFAPVWGWQSVRAHYCLHQSSNEIARHGVVRTLQDLRHLLRGRLVRVGENEQREVDKSTVDLLLKTITAESKERDLIDKYAANANKRSR